MALGAKLTLADYSTVAGEALGEDTDVLFWSNTKGAVADVTSGATNVSWDDDENRAYYGVKGTRDDILTGKASSASARWPGCAAYNDDSESAHTEKRAVWPYGPSSRRIRCKSRHMMSKTPQIELLIVDDDVVAAETTADLAVASGYAVEMARDGREALSMAKHHLPDAVVTDLRMPDMDGQELLEELMLLDPHLPVVLVTGYPDIPWAVDAMRTGAVDFASKPVDWVSIDDRLQAALRKRALRLDATTGSARLRERLGLGFGPMIGSSPPMQAVFGLTKRVAPSRASVVITGESGTGKGELAACIHDQSPRCDRPFVALHCAELTETLVESELFGHESGSFTGALDRRIGRFEQADEGTLFIDEVAEIPLRTQMKLLRVLQDRTLVRVGGNDEIGVDVRLVVATNADLVDRVEAGLFRDDLFYRLDVLRITMPPLRERGDDVMLLARCFLQQLATESGKSISDFSEAACNALTNHDWPGNVRELRNAVERAVVMCGSRTIGVEDLPSLTWGSDQLHIPGATMHEIELEAVRLTFLATGRDTGRTARLLDMPERTLQYRLRELGLSRPRGRPAKAQGKPD